MKIWISTGSGLVETLQIILHQYINVSVKFRERKQDVRGCKMQNVKLAKMQTFDSILVQNAASTLPYSYSIAELPQASTSNGL